MPAALNRTTSQENTHFKKKKKPPSTLITVVLHMVYTVQTIFIALSEHNWLPIKTLFSRYNGLLCF
jgi:hypothetical protein